MKPAPFDYTAPATLDEAVAVLANGGGDAKPLAGGQSLMPLLAFRIAQPALLVDLNQVSELAYVRETKDGGVAVGAMTRTQELQASRVIADRWPLAAAAAPLIGHRQIRNRGTVGGSLSHADPAAELPAVVLASQVTLVVQGTRQTREISASDFFQGYFATAIQPDELLTEIRVPPPPPRTGVAFLELSRRHGDFALVGVAASVTLNDRTCVEARIVLIGVADRPFVASNAMEQLRGSTITDETAAAAGAAASSAIDPISDTHASSAFRKHVGAVLTRRALLEAAQRAETPDGSGAIADR